MTLRPFSPTTALAAVLVLGAPMLGAAPRLEATRLAQARTQQPQRVMAATAHLRALQPQLGLGTRDGFTVKSAFTNAEGQAVVRLNQTYDGYRVWGSHAVAHVGLDGAVTSQTQAVKVGISLPGAPRISAEFAQRIAVAHLAPKGSMALSPRVEQVVFPAECVGGLASQWDRETRRWVLDRRNSILARPASPYVWAYEVRVHLNNPQDGMKSLAYLIDGGTGKILRINNLVQSADAPAPAKGIGKGFYRGEVAVDSALMRDGTYSLIDLTRGTRPSLYFTTFYQADEPSGWDPAIPGNQVWYLNTMYGYLFQGNATNAWGDGQAYAGSDPGGTNGQTAGVDAQAAVSTTWDFYAKVLGHQGLDGQGTSIPVLVLDATNSIYYNGQDNASWNSDWGFATFGTGSYPTNPKGFQSMVDLDIVAHELTHGVTSPDPIHLFGGDREEGGLSEAVSDFFALMVKTWAARNPEAREDVVPDTSDVAWEIGRNVGRGTPVRWLDKPSRDGVSPEGWYDGIQRLDCHHSCGPISRAFYFLCKGASSTPGAADYSPFLPGGMKGVGNDAATRIIFKAVTEHLVGNGSSSYTFQDMRAAAIMAAEQLYLQTGYTDAVKNAFAAANIGDAVGQPTRTKVLFTHFRNGDYIETTRPWQEFASYQILPRNETVVPRVAVLNNANTAVTWTPGGPSAFETGETPDGIIGGVTNPDGSWTTPNLPGWAIITATSQADPLQFAEGRAWLANMDTDMDWENDALDMGPVALSWFLEKSLNPSSSLIPAPWVNDDDVFFFVDAMRSTWPVK